MEAPNHGRLVDEQPDCSHDRFRVGITPPRVAAPFLADRRDRHVGVRGCTIQIGSLGASVQLRFVPVSRPLHGQFCPMQAVIERLELSRQPSKLGHLFPAQGIQKPSGSKLVQPRIHVSAVPEVPARAAFSRNIGMRAATHVRAVRLPCS